MTPRSKVDFWAFRCADDLAAIEKGLGGVFAGTNHLPRIEHRAGGWKGYEKVADVLLGDMSVGILAHGGDNQRGWAYVGITGQGCQWVRDWDLAQEAAEACSRYELKRVDLAVDTFEADGFERALAAYRGGAFSPPGQGGRKPKCQSIVPEREEDGATIYVGSRASDKFYRGYEKGKQLLGPSIAADMRRNPESFDLGHWLMAHMPVIRGDEVVSVHMWDWFRHEVELKPKTVPLPCDVIERRDQYFAGSYPYLGQVLQGVEPEIFAKRRDREPQLELAIALANARRMWGNTFFTALAAHHGDIGAVWDRIVGREHNQRLVSAGVLMVDHD